MAAKGRTEKDRKEQIRRDTRSLIGRITGLSDKDENLKLCVNFAESNFKYHRFLSPDSHKIERAFKGLGEKFQVHSQAKKAADLQELTDQFLTTSGLEGQDFGKTDTHYALLQLLLDLADRPTSVEFQRTQEEPTTPGQVDDFDWTSYLLPPEDRMFISYASSDSESEEDLDEAKLDKGQRQKDEEHKDVLEAEKRSGFDVGLMEQEEDLTQNTLETLTTCSVHHEAPEDLYQVLESTLVVQYWKGKGNLEQGSGGHKTSNLIKDWNAYQEQVNPFYVAPHVFVTESQIIREILWMLSGVRDLFVFQCQDQSLRVNPEVYVSHLTPNMLRSSLQPLIEKADQVHTLNSFVKDTVSQTCCILPDGSRSIPPLTYQAFATCVSDFITDFRKALTDMEKEVIKQETCLSIAKLGLDFKQWFDMVQLVYEVYTNGIVAAASMRVPSSGSEGEPMGLNNAMKASLLLNTLYQAVIENGSLKYSDRCAQFTLLLKLLIKSSQPLIDITSDWINKGQLIDPAGEFVIQRNKEIECSDEKFWDMAFLSTVSSTDGRGNANKSDKKRLASTTKKSTNELPHKYQLSNGSSRGNVSSLPKFLQPILSDAILTGKSMEVLEHLGQLAEIRQTSGSTGGDHHHPQTLFQEFLKQLNSKFGTGDVLGKSANNKNNNADKIESDRRSKREMVCEDTVIEHVLNNHGRKDTLLNMNSNGLFVLQFSSQLQEFEKENESSFLDTIDMDPTQVFRICEQHMSPFVHARYLQVCPYLVQVLKSEYNLMECIEAMQRYYLLSAGDVMCDFYTPVFNKIDTRQYWKDAAVLDMHLHEAVAPRYPADVAKLSVQVMSSNQSQTKGFISITDCIQLKYNVPWPVSLVISGTCQDMYNSVFRFLLQVKRAKHTLDHLKFQDLAQFEKDEEKSGGEVDEVSTEEEGETTMSRRMMVHRLQLLRFRLSYFINCLQEYVMTRILHSTSMEFARQLGMANDLEDIITVHHTYVQTIHDQCLLHKDLALLRGAVAKVLNLSLTCVSHWQQIARVKAHQVLDWEKELTRVVHIFSSFLNNLIKRGSFPHLESLAFALASGL